MRGSGKMHMMIYEQLLRTIAHRVWMDPYIEAHPNFTNQQIANLVSYHILYPPGAEDEDVDEVEVGDFEDKMTFGLEREESIWAWV